MQNSANECNDLQHVSIQHDLASFDIQSFGRTAIAKGEALRLKDAELEEARRVLEEEKVGSLMCHCCVSLSECKYIHANTVKWKQSLKMVQTADCFFSHGTLMKPQVTGLPSHVLYFIYSQKRAIAILVLQFLHKESMALVTNTINTYLDCIHTPTKLSYGGRSISGIGTFGHLNQASLSAMPAHLRT